MARKGNNTVSINLSFHKFQKLIFEDDSRFKIVACGRRFGKTRMGAYIAILTGISIPNGSTFIVSPSYPQTMIMWRVILKYAPPEIIKHKSIGDRVITLINGHMIWAKSADIPDNLRGEGLDLVILDEAAMMKDDVWAAAIRPALSDKKGRAIFLSTPKGKNWFYSIYKRGLSNSVKNRNYKSFHYSTYDNPFIDPEEIDEMKETLPYIEYKQEILAEFIDNGGIVFRTFKESLVPTINQDAEEGCHYVMGVDFAKHQDFTVITVFDIYSRRMVYFERFNKIDWTYQVDRIKQIYLRYNRPTVYIDSTGIGDPLYDFMRQDGIGCKGISLQNKSKKKIIDNLIMKLENREIFMFDIPDLVEEFESYEYGISPSGLTTYSAPSGMHDDIVISVALAAYGLGTLTNVIGIIDNAVTCRGNDEDNFTDYDDDIVDWEEYNADSF